MFHGFALLRRGALLGALVSLAAVGLAVPATAAAKVTSLTSCQTISSPGKYRLDTDVTAFPEGDCFDIFASNVTLILNGHTITAALLAGAGINVGGSGAQVTGPGKVTGFVIGIALGGGGGSVRGVTATDNFWGIVPASAGNSVRGNVTTNNLIGINVQPEATGNTIIGNYAHENGTDDLFDNNPNCDSNVWRGNDFGTANQPCIN
jgi:parallel beta-helix repeat protein